MTISELYQAGMGRIGPAAEPTSVREKPVVAGENRSPSAPSEFKKILDNETAKNQIHFSQHAETRIKSREISWSPELEKRIIAGVDKAEAKGSREALILAGDVAVIANVKSRTIVTAMDRSQLKDKIFTNIDSTVLV